MGLCWPDYIGSFYLCYRSRSVASYPSHVDHMLFMQVKLQLMSLPDRCQRNSCITKNCVLSTLIIQWDPGPAAVHTHTHIRMHKTMSLAATKRSCWPSEALDAWVLLRRWEPVLANPGLVPHRWGCAMSQSDGVSTQSPTWTTPISETRTAVQNLLSQ